MSRRISVVIPTLNDLTLARVLDGVSAQSRQPDELIVVGRDEAGVTARYPQARFIDTGRPVCAAAARNRGIAAASGEIIAFIDADCIPAADWLARHEQAHARGEQVVGGSVLLAGSNYWAQSDNLSMFHDFVPGHPRGYRNLLATLNLSVRRSVIETAGTMDESFPGAAAEDADWTVRMRLAGFALHFDPAAVVQHAPLRTRWQDVVRHWHNLGYSSIRMRLRYPDVFATPGFARKAHWLRLLSPLIAARVTAGIYANPIFWNQLAYLPVVYATKMIYCLGAARAVESGYAFESRPLTIEP